jgi:hypothetical protein
MPLPGWRDRRVGTADTHHGRFGWLQLNADTLFLALLATGSGIFDLLDPASNDVNNHIGGPTPLFYVRCATYIIAGLLLVYALASDRIRPEVMARAILFGGVSLSLYRHILAFGWHDNQTAPTYVLVAIVAVTSLLRIRMLLNHGGLMVTRAAHPDKEHQR